MSEDKFFYGAVSLIGGGEGALDAIDGADLIDGNGAVVITDSLVYFYHLNATSGENESAPRIIRPDNNAGDKRWILVKVILREMTQGSVLFVGAGGIVSQDNDNFFWDNVNKKLSVGWAGGDERIDFLIDYIDEAELKLRSIFETGTAGIAFRSIATANGSTYLTVLGNGTGIGVLQLYDEDDSNLLFMKCEAGVGFINTMGDDPGRLEIQKSAQGEVRLFSGCGSGLTRAFRVYGFRAGDIQRNLAIYCGVHAANTASFYGLLYYYFAGNVYIADEGYIGSVSKKDAIQIGADGGIIISQDLLVGGTFESTGIATLADASLLKTSAAPTTDAMITNKKYVDDSRSSARCSLHRNGVAQSIPNATETKILFTHEAYDNFNEYDNVTDYDFTAAVEGYHHIVVHGRLMAVTPYYNNILFKVNGVYSAYCSFPGDAGGWETTMITSKTVYLDVGDVVIFYVHHGSGATRSLRGAEQYTFATIDLVEAK